jgi:hypothetical protein
LVAGIAGNDIFRGIFVEVMGTTVKRLTGLFVGAGLDQDGESTADHVFNDAGGAGGFLRLLRIENQLCIAGTDIQDSY